MANRDEALSGSGQITARPSGEVLSADKPSRYVIDRLAPIMESAIDRTAIVHGLDQTSADDVAWNVSVIIGQGPGGTPMPTGLVMLSMPSLILGQPRIGAATPITAPDSLLDEDMAHEIVAGLMKNLTDQRQESLRL